MRGRLITAGLLLCLLSAGCAGDREAVRAAELAGTPRSGASSRSTGEAGPLLIVEDVQQIMDGIDRAWGEMMRLLVATGHPSAESQAYLEAFFDGPALRNLENRLGGAAARGFAGLRPNPGNPATTVEAVLSGGQCVKAVVRRDLSRLVETASEPVVFELVTTLRPLAPERDPGNLNSTGWVIVFERPRDQSAEGDPCAAP